MKSKPKGDLGFDPRTLRLIIGALAFAFPLTVIALTGKITTSISASYYEEENRDVFVGFLFIIGALLIAYKGLLQGWSKRRDEKLWDWIWPPKWLRVYQEDIVSTIGGVAAIFTALYPTTCDGCPMNTRAAIHMAGAVTLFLTVVYFSLVAFLRRVDRKLVRDNPRAFRPLRNKIRRVRSLKDVRSIKELVYRLFPTFSIFFSIVSKLRRDYIENNQEQISIALRNSNDGIDPDSKLAQILSEIQARKRSTRTFLWFAYQKKITRGFVYLFCGSLILITLAVYVYLAVTRPDMVAKSIITFVVETISLIFFGIAWMTASQLQYLKQILDWLKVKEPSAPPPQPAPAQPEASQPDPA